MRSILDRRASYNKAGMEKKEEKEEKKDSLRPKGYFDREARVEKDKE